MIKRLWLIECDNNLEWEDHTTWYYHINGDWLTFDSRDKAEDYKRELENYQLKQPGSPTSLIDYALLIEYTVVEITLNWNPTEL